METIVQFLVRTDTFLARGQRHHVMHAIRDGDKREVLVIGATESGQYFEALFNFGETVDTLDAGPGRASGSSPLVPASGEPEERRL